MHIQNATTNESHSSHLSGGQHISSSNATGHSDVNVQSNLTHPHLQQVVQSTHFTPSNTQRYTVTNDLSTNNTNHFNNTSPTIMQVHLFNSLV